MTVRSSVLFLSVAVNVAAATYLALLLGRHLPAAWRPRADCPQLDCSAATAAMTCPPSTCPEPAVPPPTAADAGRPRDSLQRFVVCDRTATAPLIRGLSWGGRADDAIAVHCGDSVHVIGLDTAGPRRLLRIAKSAPNVQLVARAAPVIGADVSGDGLNDLVVGFAWTDAAGAPRGGALFEFVRRRDGGLDEPRLLAPLHVSGLAAGAIDALPGADLAVLHHADVRVGQQHELILFRGGPAPLKLLAIKASPTARSVALVDLDLNGSAELIVGDSVEPPRVFEVDPGGTAQARTDLTPAGADILVHDMNGDGHDDAVMYGTKLALVIAAHEPATANLPLLDQHSASQLTAVDLNRDNQLDLVAVENDTVIGLVQSSSLQFEVHSLAALKDKHWICDGSATLRSGSGPTQIALLGRRDDHPERVELVLASSATDSWTNWDADSTPIQDAPLALNFVMP